MREEGNRMQVSHQAIVGKLGVEGGGQGFRFYLDFIGKMIFRFLGKS